MLPDMVRPDGIRKTTQVVFGGYDRRPDAADGTFYNTEGMTVQQFPLLATRNPFYKQDTRTADPGAINNDAVGMIGIGDVLIWIRDDGLVVYDGINLCHLTGGKKRLVRFGKKLLVWPDKVMIDVSRRIVGTVVDASWLLSITEAEVGDCYAVGSTGYGSTQTIAEYIGPDPSQPASWADRGPLITPLEAEVTVKYLYVQNGVLFDEAADMNTLAARRIVNGNEQIVDWENWFRPGDAVTISGCTMVPENNQTVIIREIDGNALRFYENTFRRPYKICYLSTDDMSNKSGTYDVAFLTGGDYGKQLYFTLANSFVAATDTLIYGTVSIGGVIQYRVYHYRSGSLLATSTTSETFPGTADPTEEPVLCVFRKQEDVNQTMFMETGTIKIARTLPDMDFLFEDDNRLWGCKGSEIYASKLGDPTNFNFFDGTEDGSWSVHVVSPGDFTGAISHDGFPTFFKEKIRYKVYGSKPSGYQTSETDCEGVLTGAGDSCVVVDGMLYYLSRKGVMADNGAKPRLCSEAFGPVRFGPGVTAAAGGDERVYRLSIQQGQNNVTFVYDTRSGIWLREGGRVYDGFAVAAGVMYGYRETTLWCMGPQPNQYWTEEPATDFSPFVETNDCYLVDNKRPAADHKYVYRVQLRGTIENGGSLQVYIKYDSSNTIKTIKSITGAGKKRSWYLPVHLRRCDHFRLLLGGKGWVLQSMALETKLGSAKQNR